MTPTITEQWHLDLGETEGVEVLEEYWEGLPRYTRCRIRQQWKEEGRKWLPFMYPKNSEPLRPRCFSTKGLWRFALPEPRQQAE